MNLVGRILALMGVLAAAPAAAQEFYVTAGVGAFSPSDKDIQKIYGVMPQIKLGVGLESNGFGTELDLIGSFKDGTPINIAGTPGLSSNSRLTNLGVVLRGSWAFGRRGQDVRPYFGIQSSYESVNETITLKYQGQDIGSASASANGFGFGVFAGIDLPLTKNLLLQLEGKYNSTNVKAQVDSNSSSGDAFAKTGVNAGGLSGGMDIKYFF
jgi:opacity protein-like surface antigen